MKIKIFVDILFVLISICYNILVLKIIHDILKLFRVPVLLNKLKRPIRSLMERVCGVKHSYDAPLTLVNICDPDFSLPKEFYDENPFPTPKPFSLTNAHFLCMACKLVYEEPKVVEKVVSEWGIIDEYYGNIANTKGSDTQVFMFGNSNALVLAFRGTQPLNVYNWFTDLDLSLEECSALQGRVHIGFLRALGLLDEDPKVSCKMYNDVMTKVQESIQKRPNQKIYLTGHSLGAALATIFAAQMVKSGKVDMIGALYTYGQPRVGNKEFAGAINELCHGSADYLYGDPHKDLTECKVWRFVNSNDIVPHLPPIFGYSYAHHGELIVIVADDRKIVKRPSLRRFQLGPVWSVWLGLRKIYRRFRKESNARIMMRIIGLFVMGIGNNVNDHFPCDYERNLRDLIENGQTLRELVKKNRISKTSEEESDDEEEAEDFFYKVDNRLKDLRKFVRRELSLRETVGRFKCDK